MLLMVLRQFWVFKSFSGFCDGKESWSRPKMSEGPRSGSECNKLFLSESYP